MYLLLIGFFAECGIADCVNAEMFLAFWQTPHHGGPHLVAAAFGGLLLLHFSRSLVGSWGLASPRPFRILVLRACAVFGQVIHPITNIAFCIFMVTIPPDVIVNTTSITRPLFPASRRLTPISVLLPTPLVSGLQNPARGSFCHRPWLQSMQW